MPSLVGHSIGRYHILEPLGEGGMASVYKAYDTRLERDVAVKVIRTDQFPPAALEGILKRFEREAKSLAKLSHFHIIKVIDFGEHDGAPYLIMEYMPGGTLKQKLGKPMFWQDALRLILPVARALEYAHSEGIVHRDIKPSNILITRSGEPMLTDFGIAKILESNQATALTGTGMGVGTPEYMAPEQWTGKAGPQADIYGLGVVFYELITGRKPYTADTPAAILLKQATEPLPRPRQFTQDLSEAVEKVLLKALAKSLDDRYADMGSFASALDGLDEKSPRSIENNASEPVPQAVEDMDATLELNSVDIPTSFMPAPLSQELSKQPPQAAPPGLASGTQAEGSHQAGFKKYWGAAAAALIGITLLVLLVGWAAQGGLAALAPTATPVPPTVTSLPTNTTAPTITDLPTLTPTPVATATSTPLPAVITQQGAQMGLIAAGTFSMGSESGSSDEKPVHQVTLAAFYMDKYEVTNALYKVCVDAGGCAAPGDKASYTHPNYYGNAQYDNYPVIYVDWNMSKAYCKWRGARLPTEAEWEFAARGTDGRTYPWGEVINSERANYDGPKGDTSKVGSYESGKSPFGIYDMAGNVWEWTADWYGDYSSSPSSNPAGPGSGTSRVLRGGAWNNNDNYTRSANRNRDDPANTFNNVGFRCALSR